MVSVSGTDISRIADYAENLRMRLGGVELGGGCFVLGVALGWHKVVVLQWFLGHFSGFVGWLV